MHLFQKQGVVAVFVAVIGLCSTWAAADVFHMDSGLTSLQFVPVGNAGNAADNTGYGSVAYNYNMGKFEVTAGQYCEFLNAVAKTDTYGLYNTNMDLATSSYVYGCNIKRSGPSGDYNYSVAAEWANRPVNFFSWGDAARFANWLTNGQPTGTQDANTTEDGSYVLNGAMSRDALLAVTRKADARYMIPTEDEWYKAAYYDANKAGSAGYWDYATRSDSLPSNVLSSTGTNNANYLGYDSSSTIGSPYYRNEVGAFENSVSFYGTYDQSGNVSEWNEAIPRDDFRGLRGGNFSVYPDSMRATWRGVYDPTLEYGGIGFRVAEIPEPASMALLALGGLGVLLRRRNLGQ